MTADGVGPARPSHHRSARRSANPSTLVGLACLILGTIAGCSSSPEVTEAVATPGVLTTDDVPVPFDAANVDSVTEPWIYHGHNGSLISTQYFNIYTTLSSSSMLDRLPGFYEACLREYVTRFGSLPMPKRKLEAYVFRDKRQWQNKTREVLPDQAEQFMTLGRGGFTTRGMAILFYIGSHDTFAIAAHEGWHQYTQTTFQHNLPTWLEEGIATYVEAVRRTRDGDIVLQPWNNQERRYALRRAVRRDALIPFEDLLKGAPQAFLGSSKSKLLTYYAQVWALTRFVAEAEDGKYREGLEAVLTDAAEGRLVGRLMSSDVARLGRRRGVLAQARLGPAVVKEYFNADLDVIGAEYMQFVERIASSRRWVSHATDQSGRGHAATRAVVAAAD
ncbi:MAG: hypothetical protein ACYTGR_08455 [Planctomycetota bacterium]|jgi:hypothetical protein